MDRNGIGVLVVNYFTARLVGELLASLVGQPGSAELRVCVWDNSESDAEFDRLKNFIGQSGISPSQVTQVQSEENLGYARGNNAAYRALHSRFGQPQVLLILNPDAVVTDADYASLLEHARGQALLEVATTHSPRHPHSRGLARMELRSGRFRAVSTRSGDISNLVYPGGHALIISTTAWCAVGGFSDAFFLYCEEVDLALRLHNEGKIKVCGTSPFLHVTHAGAASTGSAAKKSALTLRESTRSRVLLYRSHSHLRPWLPIVMTFRLGLGFKFLLSLDIARASAILKGLFLGLTTPLPRHRPHRLGSFR